MGNDQTMQIGNDEELRKVAEQAKLAAQLNDASIDQILALDTDLCIIAWNRACEIVTGLKQEEVLGKKFLEVLPEANKFPSVLEALRHAIKGYKSFIKWELGSYMGGYFENHFIPLKDDDGKVTGVLNIVHDVAHRIKAEKELQELNAELWKKSIELKQRVIELSNFTKVATHDLKEPLRKIYTFAELIMSHEAHKLSDAGRSNFRRIQKSVQRLSLLTDDIVTFSQVTGHEDEMVQADLGGLLLSAIDPLDMTIAHTDALIISEPLPEITCYQIPIIHLLRQIISNSLKFQEKGNAPRIYIGYELLAGSQISHPEAKADAYYHRLIFKDNGIGFEPEYSDRIFAVFQRLHPEGSFKGSGMGLAICQKVAHEHHGFMTADSTPGKGSTFACHLMHTEGVR